MSPAAPTLLSVPDGGARPRLSGAKRRMASTATAAIAAPTSPARNMAAPPARRGAGAGATGFACLAGCGGGARREQQHEVDAPRLQGFAGGAADLAGGLCLIEHAPA